MVEDRARNHGADDSQSEVEHDTLACTVKEHEDQVAGDESDKDKDSN